MLICYDFSYFVYAFSDLYLTRIVLLLLFGLFIGYLCHSVASLLRIVALGGWALFYIHYVIFDSRPICPFMYILLHLLLLPVVLVIATGFVMWVDLGWLLAFPLSSFSSCFPFPPGLDGCRSVRGHAQMPFLVLLEIDSPSWVGRLRAWPWVLSHSHPPWRLGFCCSLVLLTPTPGLSSGLALPLWGKTSSLWLMPLVICALWVIPTMVEKDFFLFYFSFLFKCSKCATCVSLGTSVDGHFNPTAQRNWPTQQKEYQLTAFSTERNLRGTITDRISFPALMLINDI